MEQGSYYNHIALSLIIPVFNEEASVHSAIESNLYVLKSFLNTYEIIVVNDGSEDGSQAIIDNFVKNHEHVSAVQSVKNYGMGSAVRIGIENAKYEYVLPVPADCPLDHHTFRLFLEHIGKYDVLVGFRPRRVGYSMRMKINSIVFHLLISSIFKVKLKDYNWIHLYKRKIFFEDGIVITSNGIMMLSEILIRAIRKNLYVKEIEIHQRERLTGVATASKLRTVGKTIIEIFSLYKKIGR